MQSEVLILVQELDNMIVRVILNRDIHEAKLETLPEPARTKQRRAIKELGTQLQRLVRIRSALAQERTSGSRLH